MKSFKFIALGIALVFALSTATGKKTTYAYCTFAVYSIIEQGPGAIVIQGADITGSVEGVDYTCLNFPREICTITTRCETVLDLGNGQYHIPINDHYTTVRGRYQ